MPGLKKKEDLRQAGQIRLLVWNTPAFVEGMEHHARDRRPGPPRRTRLAVRRSRPQPSSR